MKKNKKLNTLIRTKIISDKALLKRPPVSKLALFLLKFFLIFIVGSFLIELLDLTFVTRTLATIVGTITQTVIVNNSLLLPSITFSITNSCVGLLSVVIFASLIFSTEKPELFQKGVLFLFGATVIIIANIPRLVLVIVSAQLGFDSDLVHTLTWFLMSALALGIWYYGSLGYYKKQVSDLV